MDTQPSLFTYDQFGGANPAPLARRTDPPSSKKAAAKQKASGRINSGANIILAILRRAVRPCTYREIWSLGTDAERAKLHEANTVAKRLTILERRGLVRAGPERTCSVGGNDARVWELAEPSEAQP
jgi:hypothetical protein